MVWIADPWNLWFTLPLAVALLVGTIWGVARREAARLRKTWAPVAQALGGTIELAQAAFIAVEYRVHGRRAELSQERGERSSATVMISMEGVSPGTLSIHRQVAIPDLLDRIFAGQDLTIGDRKFDREFVIKARPESLASGIFAPERRATVIATVRRLDGFSSPWIHLTREALEISVRDELNPDELLELAATAEEFLGHLLNRKAGDGVEWSVAGISSGGTCSVCGTVMESHLVKCRKCKTPHHRDCWVYAGKCSTFACGEKRFSQG